MGGRLCSKALYYSMDKGPGLDCWSCGRAGVLLALRGVHTQGHCIDVLLRSRFFPVS